MLFLNYLPLEIEQDTLFQETWIHFTQGCIVPGLVEIGPVLLEKKILNFANVLLLFLNYLPLQIEQGSSFEHTWIPFTKGCIVPSLVKIGPLFQKRKFLIFANVFLIFHDHLPLEKGRALHLNKLDFPLPHADLFTPAKPCQ